MTTGGGAGGDDDAGPDDGGRGNDVLAAYVESPEAGTCLVLVAADINRTTKLSKTLVKHAVLVEQWGLKGEKELRGFGINEALERAQKFIIAAAKKAGMTIDRDAFEPLIEHAGTDIATLRGDVERAHPVLPGQDEHHAGGCADDRQRLDVDQCVGRDQRDREERRRAKR